MRTKEILLFAFVFLFIVFTLSHVQAQGTVYCAEKTTSGASCVVVSNPSECDTSNGLKCEERSCGATNYCSTGTCLNSVTGECLPGPAATCDPQKGGSWFDKPKEDVEECATGCCVLGDGASISERSRCDALGRDYNVVPEFLPNIQDEQVCLSMASPDAKGAVTFDTSVGRGCSIMTRKEFQEKKASDESAIFHENLLCTAVTDEGHISICRKTRRTTCVDGENDVYFVDSCGNLANVYDANKIDDEAYWSYVPGIKGVEVDVGDDNGNAGSSIYGDCDYIGGSTCGLGNAKYGSYICKDLGCGASELTGGIAREHGEEWCSSPREDFEDAVPGEVSYKLYCYDGEVSYELCDYSRNKLCVEDETTGSAACVVNKWQACGNPEIKTTSDCLDAGDCKVVEGASVGFLRTQYGTESTLVDNESGKEIRATCVPKYSPGFNFWDPEGTLLDNGEGETPTSICTFASVNCVVPYTQEIYGVTKFRVTPSDGCVATCKEVEDWSSSKCFDACTPVCLQESFGAMSPNTEVSINKDWAESYQNLCVSLGDCGVSGNYLGHEGYNSWRDLYSGKKINWDSLINGDKKK